MSLQRGLQKGMARLSCGSKGLPQMGHVMREGTAGNTAGTQEAAVEVGVFVFVSVLALPSALPSLPLLSAAAAFLYDSLR